MLDQATGELDRLQRELAACSSCGSGSAPTSAESAPFLNGCTKDRIGPFTRRRGLTVETTDAEVARRLAELAQEIFELPAIVRDLVGPRCGEAVDRAVQARRMVRELRELLGVDTTEGD